MFNRKVIGKLTVGALLTPLRKVSNHNEIGKVIVGALTGLS